MPSLTLRFNAAAMHPNPVFHTQDAARNLAYARDRGFGTLTLSGADRPMVSHIPFLLSDDGSTADLHLVGSNPIARSPDRSFPGVIAVLGPDSYISPDWYGVADQVPTWNYVAVHLTGRLERLPETAMRDMLDRQSAAYEARLHPKIPWTIDKMSPEARDRMMRQILPFRFFVESVDGTWKLSQNKPAPAREAAAALIDAADMGTDTTTLATLMRNA